MTVPFDQLKFDNRFVRDLPGDPLETNSVRQVTKACYSNVRPTPASDPTIVAIAPEVAELLDVDLGNSDLNQIARVMSGTELLDGMQPMAMCYGGHQFGNWAGQLGDGRAINLGDVVGKDQKHWTLQLKGAGLTPYSRTADGLAVLRSSVREFLCSEAMFHLGVPTTRALSLVLTGDKVVRDMFYDGNPQYERGAVVCRVAPSFIRFGSFEIFAARNDIETLRSLTRFTIQTEFPNILDQHAGEFTAATYVAFFHEVCRTTAEMMVHWLRVGFVHGVMNTDNMSILGLTIDYGPYGWLEDYNPNWTPNTTDSAHGRYRFGNQPQIAHWNLAQLARALFSLIEDAEGLQEGLALYASKFQMQWQSMMIAKLGLSTWDAKADEDLIADLLDLLQLAETDMTIFFRCLSSATADQQQSDSDLIALISDAFYQPDELTQQHRQATTAWLRRYQQRLAQNDLSSDERRQKMESVNPKYVLRNYLAQLAIDKADEGDYSMVNDLLDVLRRPYTDQPGKEQFAEKRPEWARHRPGCSMLSCSS